MNRRQKLLALAEIMEPMVDFELVYRQNRTTDLANQIYGRDHDLLEALQTWIKLERYGQ